jgi:hypothetical protein
MLTPPTHLILPMHLLGVCVALHSILYLLFWIMITFYKFLSSLFDIFTCVFWKSPPEPASQIKSNFVQIILRWREIKIVQIKGQSLVKGEIITKMQKWNSADPGMYKLWSLWVGRVHNRWSIFTCVYLKESKLVQIILAWREFKFIQMRDLEKSSSKGG